MEKSELNVLLRISSIVLDKFTLVDSVPSSLLISAGVNKNEIQFEFSVGIEINTIKKIITTFLTIKLFADKEKKSFLAEMISTSTFEIHNLDEILKNNNDNIPDALLLNLIGLHVSTSRGFLILKTQGTMLDGIILPAIPINQIISSDKIQGNRIT